MTTFPGVNLILTGIFAVFVAATAGGALLAVFTARIIRGVCGLALSCIGLAGIYYFLQSPFLALMEILIYVGAVCVTIVFAVMLAEPDEPAAGDRRATTLLWGAAGVVLAAGVFAGVGWLSTQGTWPAAPVRTNDGSVEAIGLALLTRYSVAFELISLVLLVAILGALAIARTRRSPE